MRKIVWSVAFLFFLLVRPPLVWAQTPTNLIPRAVPAGMDLSAYPILPEHVMSVAEMAKLKLRPVTIEKDTVVLNFSHRSRAFLLDTLKVGDIVAANDRGDFVYKADCSNRIAQIKDCPACPPAPALAPPAPPVNPGAETSPTGGYSMPGWLRSLWRGLASLVLLGLALALLALLLGALYLFGRWLYSIVQAGGPNQQPQAQAIQPAVPPAAIVPAPRPAPRPQPVPPQRIPVPVHPILGRPQRQANGALRYGPFEDIEVSDRQVNGFRVTVDGDDAGNFLQDVRIVNAGAEGSYLEVAQAEPALA